jgi:FkbM family methyltransferase
VKFFRLTLAAVLTALVCVLYLYFFENLKLYGTYRCMIAAPHWYDCYRKEGLKEFDFATDFYGMRYEGNVKNGIDREVLLLGAYEKPILHFMRDVMKLIYSNQGVFLDIGANVGQHSLFMSRYVKDVHAFEPYEPVLERFRRMKEINDVKNIVIHPVGLGNENKKLPFYEPPETNLGQGSFLKEFNSQNTSSEELEIVVGDEILQSVNVISSVNLVKLDVEGYEKSVLEGLSRTLEANRPVVVFEIHVSSRNSFGFKNDAEVRNIFPKDYEFLVFDQFCDPYTGFYQLAEFRREVFDVPSRYRVVAYPAEKRDLIPRRSQQEKPGKRRVTFQ